MKYPRWFISSAVGWQGLCKFCGVVGGICVGEGTELSIRLANDEEGSSDGLPAHLTVGGETQQLALLVAD